MLYELHIYSSIVSQVSNWNHLIRNQYKKIDCKWSVNIKETNKIQLKMFTRNTTTAAPEKTQNEQSVLHWLMTSKPGKFKRFNNT